MDKVKLQVFVSSGLADRIDVLANECGLSRSAYCASLLADAVRTKEASARFVESLPQTAKELLSNPDVVSAIKKTAPSV